MTLEDYYCHSFTLNGEATSKYYIYSRLARIIYVKKNMFIIVSHLIHDKDPIRMITILKTSDLQ